MSAVLFWYAGPPSGAGRSLHATEGERSGRVSAPTACNSGGVMLDPRVDGTWLSRCAVCCRATGTPRGNGPSLEVSVAVRVRWSDEIIMFVHDWPLDAGDSVYYDWQLGTVTHVHLLAEAKAAGVMLVGAPRWEKSADGSRYGVLRATVDARRILTDAPADGRVSA